MKLRKLRPQARFLREELTEDTWEPLPDPRRARGVRFRWMGLLNLLMLGMLIHARTLRHVERLTRFLAVPSAFGLRGAPSDTCLFETIGRLIPEQLREVLRAQVLRLHRSKRMEVLPEIGLSLVAIDGKVLGTDRTEKNPASTRMKVGRRQDGRARKRVMKKGQENWNVADVKPNADGEVFLVKALRAVHVGSATKPILDQVAIPKGRGESTTLLPFLRDLYKAYGNLIECLSLDAVYATRHVLAALAVARIHYILALKGNAGQLYYRLRRLMGDGETEPPGGWACEVETCRNGRRIRRSFARHFLRGYCLEGDFQQVWRQRTVITSKVSGQILSVDDRLWISSLPRERLTPQQAMAAIRAHWGVENDANWTLDAIWGEDTYTWVHKGRARESLGLLRAIAYNLVRVLRHRVLQPSTGGSLSYDELFERIHLALVTPAVLPAVGAT